jgi:hypothetical protein
MPRSMIHVNTSERIVEVSSPSGGCLIALREHNGRLIIEVYQADPTVTVRVAKNRG